MLECPRCKGKHFWHLRTGQRRCRRCRLTRMFKQVGWKKTRISRYWKGRLVEFFGLGVPAYRLRFQVPLHPQTIARWFRKLREIIYVHALRELSQLRGVLEMDEAVFGGRKKWGRGWNATDKHIVFGIYKRNGKVITFPIAHHTFAEIAPLVAKHTNLDSLYYTDEWLAYGFLPLRKNHVVVRKEKGVPKGRDHINGIEGFWSYAKHWLYQYRGVPKKYFHLYLKEVEWRFNHRNENLVISLRKLLDRQSI